jgi:hypothetical protein
VPLKPALIACNSPTSISKKETPKKFLEFEPLFWYLWKTHHQNRQFNAHARDGPSTRRQDRGRWLQFRRLNHDSALVRYNANGSLETNFDTDFGTDVNAHTFALKLQSDGKLWSLDSVPLAEINSHSSDTTLEVIAHKTHRSSMHAHVIHCLR